MSHKEFMLEAIREGELGRLTAPPNPWVGAIIVKDNKIIGRGYHHAPGQPHAEIMAMKSVMHQEALVGATCYTTLEPCSHYGRTGPCCEALVNAGITECVFGVRDPDLKVSGRGIEYLEDHGVKVFQVCEHEVQDSLRAYLHHRETSRPYVVLKSATTMDGKIACLDRTSQWITGEQARSRVMRIRAESQAILVGSGTVLADNPRLTVRGDNTLPSQPIRVVVDRRGRLGQHPDLNVFDSSAKTLIFTEDPTGYTALEDLKNVSVIFKLEVSLQDILDELGKRGIIQLMVEGGSEIHSSFLCENLVDEINLFVGATVFGRGVSWLNSTICETISDAKFWNLERVERLGNDVELRYRRDEGTK